MLPVDRQYTSPQIIDITVFCNFFFIPVPDVIVHCIMIMLNSNTITITITIIKLCGKIVKSLEFNLNIYI